MRQAIGKPVVRIAKEATQGIRALRGAHAQPTGRPTLPTLGAFGAGAVLMYFLDPSRGNRRRKLLVGKAMHAGNAVGGAAGKTARHLRNKATGVVAITRHRRMRETVDDHVLVERVRAALGRIVSHPGAIQVTAQDGTIALAGPVLRVEARRLLRRAARVRGVRGVEDKLEIHDSAEGVPALQGGTRP